MDRTAMLKLGAEARTEKMSGLRLFGLMVGVGLLILSMAGCAQATLPVNPTALPTSETAMGNATIVSMTAQPEQFSTNVKIQAGEIQGTLENNLVVFKGIPYAAPPLGELRWQTPQPVTPWGEVRKADAFGDACIQPLPGPNSVGAEGLGPQSEDCLYLNVWTPTTDPNAKLPVMFWIHGGALVIGAGSLPLYDGASLAERGAVVVTINYRLGPLGFFTHPALDAQDSGGAVNFGFYDQIAALKWVQENIAQFGGDPNNVTIFGESAGAQSVLTHFASPLSRGLFHKGIAESSYSIPAHTRTAAQKVGIAVVDAVGLDGADATLQDLRAVPADKFQGILSKATTLAPVFVVGDAAIPDSILNVFQKGTQAQVPLIIGSNSDEATVATAFGVDPGKLIEQMGLARVAVKALYPGVNDNEQLGSDLIRDLLFTSWVKRIADLHAEHAPSWRYYFSYVPVNLRNKEPGVPHGGELVFVFDTGDIAPQYKGVFTDADREMARQVGDYWFEFAKTGKPDAEGQPEWVGASRTSDETIEFGDTVAMQKNMMRARLDVFIGLFRILGGLLERENQ
jgi:para-nitrobenzyl esterase